MQIDAKLFLLRLRVALDIKSNIELAKVLDVPYSTLNTWLTRNSLPLEAIISKSVCDNVSVDMLLGKENGEIFKFSKFPSLIAAMDLATSTEEATLKFNTQLDSFIIEVIIGKLRSLYAISKRDIPKNLLKRTLSVLFNVTEGRFLMLLDEMLGKLKDVKSENARDKIQELISGDLLHPFLSKPIFKKSEKIAFQSWADDLSIEEAEFFVDNVDTIRNSLESLIPKISKANTSFDVRMMKKLTS